MSGRKELTIGPGAKGKKGKGRKRGKKKAKAQRKTSADLRAEARENKAKFELLLVQQKMEEVAQRCQRVMAENEQLELHIELSHGSEGGFATFIEESKQRDRKEAKEIKSLLSRIAEFRANNMGIDDRLTAKMTAKIMETKDRTKAYNELKAQHKERMEYLAKNQHLEQDLEAARKDCVRLERELADLLAAVRAFEISNPTLMHDRVGELRTKPPALARVLLLMATRNITHEKFILDCYNGMNDLMSPDFPCAAELATAMGRTFITDTLAIHGGNPRIITVTLRVLRKLVSLQPQTIDYFVQAGTLGRITRYMNQHWWCAAVQDAGTHAIIGLVPRHILDACEPSATGASLANVVRSCYGKLTGAHVAVGVLRCVIKAKRAKAPGGAHHNERFSTWQNSTFDPGHSDSEDDDSSMYLLRQRLVAHTLAAKDLLAAAERAAIPGMSRTSRTPPRLHLQALFATILLVLEDRNHKHLYPEPKAETRPVSPDRPAVRREARDNGDRARRRVESSAASLATRSRVASRAGSRAGTRVGSRAGTRATSAVGGARSGGAGASSSTSVAASAAASFAITGPGAAAPSVPTAAPDPDAVARAAAGWGAGGLASAVHQAKGRGGGAAAGSGPAAGQAVVVASRIAELRRRSQHAVNRLKQVLLLDKLASKDKPLRPGEVVSAMTGKRIEDGVITAAAAMARILKYVVTDETTLDAVANYRCLTIMLLLLKNQHHRPGMPQNGTTTCWTLSYMLTKQAFSRRLLRRMDILSAVIRTAYNFSTSQAIIEAASPIIEYFGGNHSACVRLIEANDEEEGEIGAGTGGGGLDDSMGSFGGSPRHAVDDVSNTARMRALNDLLEQPGVGEVAANHHADHSYLRTDRPLSRPAGVGLDFKRMFSKGLMVLRKEQEVDSSDDEGVVGPGPGGVGLGLSAGVGAGAGAGPAVAASGLSPSSGLDAVGTMVEVVTEGAEEVGEDTVDEEAGVDSPVAPRGRPVYIVRQTEDSSDSDSLSDSDASSINSDSSGLSDFSGSSGFVSGGEVTEILRRAMIVAGGGVDEAAVAHHQSVAAAGGLGSFVAMAAETAADVETARSGHNDAGRLAGAVESADGDAKSVDSEIVVVETIA